MPRPVARRAYLGERERPMKWLTGAFILLLSAAQGWAQTWPNGVSDLPSTPTLSVTSGNCLAANAARKTLTLDNTGGTIAIGYCQTSPATPNTPCTAAIGTAGTTTLAAGRLHYWQAAPINQFCFIAASGTPGLTIREGR
jgi:hypothetical protein